MRSARARSWYKSNYEEGFVKEGKFKPGDKVKIAPNQEKYKDKWFEKKIGIIIRGYVRVNFGPQARYTGMVFGPPYRNPMYEIDFGGVVRRIQSGSIVFADKRKRR